MAGFTRPLCFPLIFTLRSCCLAPKLRFHLVPNVLVTHEVMPSAEVIPFGLGTQSTETLLQGQDVPKQLVPRERESLGTR